MNRIAVTSRLGFREQRRRPLLLVLLVGLPFFFITRAIAQTEPIARRVGLSGGAEVVTTMRDVHGADMATITIAFLAGLVGVFVVQSARQADRRLVVAGFQPAEALAPRLLVLGAAILLVVAVSLAVTALSFTPEQWPAFVIGNALVGLIYGLLGALAGVLVGPLGATYLILFSAMLDLGVVQNPMFGTGTPPGWAAALPDYGPARVVVEAAFAPDFHAWGDAALAVAWAAALVAAVLATLVHLLAVDTDG